MESHGIIRGPDPIIRSLGSRLQGRRARRPLNLRRLFFFESAFVYRNSYLVQGQDAVSYLRTKIDRDKSEG